MSKACVGVSATPSGIVRFGLGGVFGTKVEPPSGINVAETDLNALPRAFWLFGDTSELQVIFRQTYRQWQWDPKQIIPHGAYVKLFFLASDRSTGEFLWCKMQQQYPETVPGDVAPGRYLGKLTMSALGALNLRAGDLVSFHSREVMGMETSERDMMREWRGDASTVGSTASA